MNDKNLTPHCDCRAKSIRNVTIVALVVGVVSTLLTRTAFRGQPYAQAVFGVITGLSIVTYCIARMLDRDRQIHWIVYMVVMAAGLVLSAVATLRAF